MNRNLALRLTVAVLAFAGPPVLPALAAVPLANYRSVHDLTLAEGSELDIGTVRGRLVTEFTGSECSGYATRTRFVTRFGNEEGDFKTDDVRSMMFESNDGFYEFTHETFDGDALTERVVGTAIRGSDGTTVELTEPQAATLDLPLETAFPTEQVTRIIDAGLAGERFVAFDLYDGTDGGDGLYSTSAVVGEVSTAHDDLGVETAVADAGFAGQRHWRVTISYFQQPAGTGMTPDYTMSLVVYENGISRDVRLDYGNFGLVGKLTELEMLPSPECPD